MEQSNLLSGVNFRNGQSFGSLQHAPQFTHSPLRVSETGNIAVKVLFVLASNVFLLSVIIQYLDITLSDNAVKSKCLDKLRNFTEGYLRNRSRFGFIAATLALHLRRDFMIF